MHVSVCFIVQTALMEVAITTRFYKRYLRLDVVTGYQAAFS